MSLLVFMLAATMFSPLANSQLIIAHRGASHDAPENTLAAFELAWKSNADGIEADFHLTSDLKIVCIHDEDTSRVCPDMPSLTIVKTSLATLQQLDVGSWRDPKFAGERMPTLSQVLATVPLGKQIFIHVKTGPEILPTLKDELAQCSLKPEQIHILSFRSDVLRQIKELMPKYSATWLVDYQKHGGKDGKPSKWYPTAERVLEKFAKVDATALDSRNVAEIVNQDFVDAVKKSGADFHVWTIDDPENAIRLRSLGVTSITTNRPALLYRTLNTASSE